MKKTIFNLKEPSHGFITEWNEERTYYITETIGGDKVKLHIDDGHHLSFGKVTYFPLWKNENGKFIQSEMFYANGLGKINSKNEVLAQIITHVIPDKFVNKLIEIAHRFR
jgi:uncharacterized hydantoinase/oxoprolinase family protein